MRGAAALAALLLAACGGSEGRKSGPIPVDTAARMPLDTTISAPDTAAPSVLPESDTSASPAPTPVTIVFRSDSAAGDLLYHGKGRCFTCHGDHGTGTAGLGPDLTDSTWLDIDGSLPSIALSIAQGVAAPRQFSVAMPSYASVLSPVEIGRVAAYVFTLSHPGWTTADSTAHDSARATDSTARRPTAPPSPPRP